MSRTITAVVLVHMKYLILSGSVVALSLLRGPAERSCFCGTGKSPACQPSSHLQSEKGRFIQNSVTHQKGKELALGFVFSFSFQGKADIALLLFALIYEACAEARGALDSSFSPWMGNDRDQEGGRNELLC